MATRAGRQSLPGWRDFDGSVRVGRRLWDLQVAAVWQFLFPPDGEERADFLVFMLELMIYSCVSHYGATLALTDANMVQVPSTPLELLKPF